jgi:hypothetical protein
MAESGQPAAAEMNLPPGAETGLYLLRNRAWICCRIGSAASGGIGPQIGVSADTRVRYYKVKHLHEIKNHADVFQMLRIGV